MDVQEEVKRLKKKGWTSQKICLELLHRESTGSKWNLDDLWPYTYKDLDKIYENFKNINTKEGCCSL